MLFCCNYGKLHAQFHVGGSRLIEMVGFMSFFQFPARTIIKICLKYLTAWLGRDSSLGLCHPIKRAYALRQSGYEEFLQMLTNTVGW